MNNAERIQNSKEKETLTLQRGPGRYHQSKSLAEIRSSVESQENR